VLTIIVYGLALVALLVLLQQVATWGQRRVDDLRYGFPRTVQIEGVVSPSDTPQTPTHVIALNLRGQVSVLVLPGSDASKLQTLAGPYIVGSDGAYAVPQPSLKDVNDDGRADLLVNIRGETVVYVHENGTFRLMTPEERAALGASSGT
jgi:hypothetical protein